MCLPPSTFCSPLSATLEPTARITLLKTSAFHVSKDAPDFTSCFASSLRVLRIFFVPAHFPVDDYYCRGSMRCKAHAKSFAEGTDSYTVALSHLHARKPFRIRTCEKRRCKSSGIRTCKIIGLKIPWNQHLQKKVGVGVSRLPPFSLSTCCPASLKGCPEASRLDPPCSRGYSGSWRVEQKSLRSNPFCCEPGHASRLF